jgi:hypothetical protein
MNTSSKLVWLYLARFCFLSISASRSAGIRFLCSYPGCDKSYADNSSLHRHKKKAHGYQPKQVAGRLSPYQRVSKPAGSLAPVYSKANNVESLATTSQAPLPLLSTGGNELMQFDPLLDFCQPLPIMPQHESAVFRADGVTDHLNSCLPDFSYLLDSHGSFTSTPSSIPTSPSMSFEDAALNVLPDHHQPPSATLYRPATAPPHPQHMSTCLLSSSWLTATVSSSVAPHGRQPGRSLSVPVFPLVQQPWLATPRHSPSVGNPLSLPLCPVSPSITPLSPGLFGIA